MSSSQPIEVELEVRVLNIGVVGTTPLICHNKEMVAEILEGGKDPTQQKDMETDPEAEFRRSLYEMPEHAEAQYGVPSIMFKKSMVRATKATDMSMTDARQAFFIHGVESDDMVSLQHPETEPDMRRDVVSVGRGSNNDVRYRGQFREWSAEMNIRYNNSLINGKGVVQLLSIAGFGVGIGDWRPEKDGQYGRFEINSADEQATPAGRAEDLLDGVDEE